MPLSVVRKASIVLCAYLGLGVAVVANNRRWKLHPMIDMALERIKIGEITSIKDRQVIGCLTREARQQYLSAERANDKEGFEELAAAGKTGGLSEGTQVRVIERDESELDRLMNAVHSLLDIDTEAWKDCERRNIRRATIGIRAQPCGNASFEVTYNRCLTQSLIGATPEAFVENNVLVYVRVLQGPQSGKKHWVLYRQLLSPSTSQPPNQPE